MRRLFHIIGVLFSICLSTTLSSQHLYAQPKGPRNDPRHINYDSLRFFGQMTLTGCKPGIGNFSGEIYPLGIIAPGMPTAWLLQRVRCDTAFGYHQPKDLLLYHGAPNGLPSVEQHQRIGASELAAEVLFLCTGDFDDNDYHDIVVRMEVYDDTTFGKLPYPVQHLIVFWGGSAGYSVHDTTRLSCGADSWSGPEQALSYDFDHDGVDDLFVGNGFGQGLKDGEIVDVPKRYIYLGHRGRRWGTISTQRTADWASRDIMSMKDLNRRLVDQDCDGNLDIISYNNVNGGIGGIRILYGTPQGGFPDTTNIEAVTFTAAQGEYSLLSDVTGDGVPELLVSAPSVDLIRVYAGKPGQRIIEQYGNGTDSLDKLNARYPLRPWAEIWLPYRLHDGWSAGGGALDLGDITGDSADEIWSSSWPFLISYLSRQKLDSIIDVLYRWNTPSDYKRLGDIDGSGKPTISIGYNGTVVYLKPGRIPSSGNNRQLPHSLAFRCGSTSDFNEPPFERPTCFQLTVHPNPADDRIRIMWTPEPSVDVGLLVVSDVLGREVYRSRIIPDKGNASWDTGNIVGGIYYVTVRIGAISETKEVVIR